MSEIVIEAVNTVKDINKHSFIDYTPFTANGDLVYIKKDWWYNLPSRQRETIKQNYSEHYGYCVRDEINCYNRDGESFWKFYNAYLSSYTTKCWVYCLKSEYLSTGFDKQIIDNILNLSENCKNQYFEAIESDIEFYTDMYRNPIEKYIKRHESTGVFFKISDKSGKYRGEINPKFSLLDIVNEIIHNQDLINTLKQYGVKSSLLIRPWNYEISVENEFRVIVNNKRITGISQQQCYKYVNLTKEKMTEYTKSIIDRFNEIKHKFPYNSCVMDMWIDKNKIAHIIEMNPGECWGNSGSGLFHWITDFEKLYSNNKTYVRYIDINSPLIKKSPITTSDSTGSLGMCPSLVL